MLKKLYGMFTVPCKGEVLSIFLSISTETCKKTQFSLIKIGEKDYLM